MKVVGKRSEVAREKSLYNAGGKMTLQLRLAFLRYYISSVLRLFAAGTIKPKNLLFFLHFHSRNSLARILKISNRPMP